MSTDLPKAVEEYSQRSVKFTVVTPAFHSLKVVYPNSVAPAMASNYSRAGVVINFVTATGGDVEMLRSIECFYKLSWNTDYPHTSADEDIPYQN